jgi:hypothetical protein
MRALQTTEDEAKEWLLKAATRKTWKDRMPVRFTPEAMLEQEGNKRAAVRGWEPPEHAAHEEGLHCVWYKPVDYMGRKQPMTQLSVERDTEWDAGKLAAELDKVAKPRGKPRKGVGGRPPHAFWHILGVEAGAWMTDEGTSEAEFDKLRAFLEERLAHHGFDVDKSLIQDWSRKFLDTFLAYRNEEN